MALGQTTLHAAAAKQNRDAPLDARSEALAPLEGRALLKGFALGRLLAAALWNAGERHTGFIAVFDAVLAEEPAITTEEFWCITERFGVTLKTRSDLRLVARIAIEHTVLRDQPQSAFGQEHLVAELDGFLRLASLDQIRVWLKDRVDLLFGRHRLFLENATARLIDDPLAEPAIVLDLNPQVPDHDVAERIDAAQVAGPFEHATGVLDHPLGGAYQVSILSSLPVVPLLGRHALDFLHTTPGATRAVGKPCNALREQFTQAPDKPRDNAHAIPQQSAVGRVVNVGFHHGGIDTQFPAILQP